MAVFSIVLYLTTLNHWGRATHICIRKLTIIDSDNGLSPDRHQAIIWTNAGILVIGPLGTYFSGMLIESHRSVLDNRHDCALFWCALSGPRDWTLRDWSRAWPTLTWLAKLVGVSVSSSIRNTNFPHTLKPWSSLASVFIQENAL